MKNLKNEIRDYVLSRGAYASCRLAIDYRVELMCQHDFVIFNNLFRKIKVVYRNGAPDDELHQLTTAFVNSLFWNCERVDGELDDAIIDDMVDRIYVEQMLLRQLRMIADCYKSQRADYSPEKVILMQSIASLADFGQSADFPYLYSLVPFLLIKELTQWVDDIWKFESKTVEQIQGTTNVRGQVMRTLNYLSERQLEGLIISHEEYVRLCDEVCELMANGRLPTKICRLELKANGSLISGYSWMFVAYGIGILYRKNRLPRELWIEYLERKIAKPKGTLLKKFGMRPERWRELITRE